MVKLLPNFVPPTMAITSPVSLKTGLPVIPGDTSVLMLILPCSSSDTILPRNTDNSEYCGKPSIKTDCATCIRDWVNLTGRYDSPAVEILRSAKLTSLSILIRSAGWAGLEVDPSDTVILVPELSGAQKRLAAVRAYPWSFNMKQVPVFDGQEGLPPAFEKFKVKNPIDGLLRCTRSAPLTGRWGLELVLGRAGPSPGLRRLRNVTISARRSELDISAVSAKKRKFAAALSGSLFALMDSRIRP